MGCKSAKNITEIQILPEIGHQGKVPSMIKKLSFGRIAEVSSRPSSRTPSPIKPIEFNEKRSFKSLRERS